MLDLTGRLFRIVLCGVCVCVCVFSYSWIMLHRRSFTEACLAWGMVQPQLCTGISIFVPGRMRAQYLYQTKQCPACNGEVTSTVHTKQYWS
jgi:hypothetical protein